MSIKLTKKRQAILDELKNHHGTCTAKELHEHLPDIDLVTIYRSLDLFVQEKMIKAINFSGTNTTYEYQTEPHHHAVCSDCNKVFHFTAADKKMKDLLQLEHFTIDDIEVTVRGTCTAHKNN